MAVEKTSEDANFESKIVEVVTSHPKGVSNKTLEDAIPLMSKTQLVNGLNNLISQKKIDIFRNKANQLVYMLKKSGSTKQCHGSDIEEKVVFEAVERAGDNGVTSNELKRACNLQVPRINKILKGLESKSMVKSVTGVQASRKKVYILYHVEPSTAVIGGTFYSGSDFEAEFVDVLAEQCYKYLLKAKADADRFSDPISQRNASMKSSKEICDCIIDLKISKVNLTVKDIESILDSLIYDRKIEKIVTISGASTSKTATQNLYRASKPLVTSAALMRMPCGVCQIFQDCRPGGEISPSTCVYMREWLEF